ncbi:MAG: hypothetical protein LLG15_08790 [Betaproteobacteria bacterium]|nr:hypothetical protein [Betaproteobacteria bacterium]
MAAMPLTRYVWASSSASALTERRGGENRQGKYNTQPGKHGLHKNYLPFFTTDKKSKSNAASKESVILPDDTINDCNPSVAQRHVHSNTKISRQGQDNHTKKAMQATANGLV